MISLGFTFSFPCQQESLASARLTAWTKGFSCSGVVNEDVVKLLQEAINEKVPVNICTTNYIDTRYNACYFLIGYQCKMCVLSQ